MASGSDRGIPFWFLSGGSVAGTGDSRLNYNKASLKSLNFKEKSDATSLPDENAACLLGVVTGERIRIVT